MQAWSVVAVTDPDSKRRLAAVAGGQRHVEQCPLFLVFLADLSRHARLAERTGRPLEGLPFLETFLVAALDAGLAAQNAVVAAESLGLGTVYIGALRNDLEAVAAELGLPPGATAVFGLCVGYPAPDGGAVKPRLPQSAVLHHERYDPEAD
ncbi:nitroreductase family protein, partial [Roseomonas sp. DSM 102946]|nr:nitroreductase family protein [Roseomonas sp. DSM 102946]